MGHSYRRTGVANKPRYAAIFRDARGIRRSAGTYPTKKEADRAWATAEADALLGNGHDPRRGKVAFRDYVTGVWFPNHQLEDTTRQRYSYTINKYLIPEFGAMKMSDIAPVHVREWITRLKNVDVSASTITDVKTVLSAVFTTALNDQIVAIHPVRGVKTPTVARRPRTIVTPEQFDAIHAALPNESWRMLIELDVETGLRWGELTELRVRDVNPASRMLTVARAVIEVNAPFRDADAGRFGVKEYPKDKEYRRVKLSPDITTALARHIETNRLGRDDLLFPMPTEAHSDTAVVVTPPPDNASVTDELGRTVPNATGRTYAHGTMSGYNLGHCRCPHCRDACARYRAERRADGKDDPRNVRLGRSVDTDRHIPRRWFATHIWRPAVADANLDFHVRVHDLRHAHASWLLAGGADIQIVKERLGHGSLRTTEKYLHTLPDHDDTALDALRRTRTRTTQ
jgi:site-specific recombinase XerD